MKEPIANQDFDFEPASAHYSAGLSYGQVAEILGCSKQAVHQCEQRALKKLRKKLTKSPK